MDQMRHPKSALNRIKMTPSYVMICIMNRKTKHYSRSSINKETVGRRHTTGHWKIFAALMHVKMEYNLKRKN